MEYIDRRLSEGLENCVGLLRELRSRGYEGSYTVLSEYVRPRRRQRQTKATVRFETAPGEQAQVDWGSLAYIGADGRKHRIWVFVMVLSWSRACYVELVRRADTAAFIQCHVNAFEYLSGVPRRCLYGNAQVVTPGRDEDQRLVWNLRMLDFARRLGFEMRLCRPYRAQTKGKVESGVKYVRRNPCSSHGQAMWPSLCFTDDAYLNRQGLEWCDNMANRRVQGTTRRIPWEMLAEERSHLGRLPSRASLAPYLREDRKVARDGFVSWEGFRYGVHWKWVGTVVQVGQRQGTVEIWVGDERIAVHPKSQLPGQSFVLPGQWEGLPKGDNRPRREALAVQTPVGEVERRSLDVHEAEVELAEDIPGNGEDGSVVDFEDYSPSGQGLGLGVTNFGAADEAEGLDPFVLSRDALVEDQGVGDDGTGHAAGLGNVGHSQEAGDLPSCDGIQVFEFVQDDRGPFDAVLQSVGSEVHFLPGNGDQPDKVSKVGGGSFQPARFGKAAAVLVEDTVGEAGVGDGLRYVVGVTD